MAAGQAESVQTTPGFWIDTANKQTSNIALTSRSFALVQREGVPATL
jgi:hypothetical protein